MIQRNQSKNVSNIQLLSQISKQNYNNQPKTNTTLQNLSEIKLKSNPQQNQVDSQCQRTNQCQPFKQLNESQIIEPNLSLNLMSLGEIFKDITLTPFDTQQQQSQIQQTPKQKKLQFNNKNVFANNEKNQTQQQNKESSGNALIKFILQKNKRKIVHHKVNVINPEMVLYKKCEKKFIKSGIYEEVNRNGKKLDFIYNKIREQFNSLEQIKKKSQAYESSKLLNRSNLKTTQKKNSTKTTNSQSLSSIQLKKSIQINVSQQKPTPRRKPSISRSMLTLSGLLTYKFKSQKAKQSLISAISYNQSSQTQLLKQLKQIKFRSNCTLQRQSKISIRSVHGKDKQTRQKQISLRQSLIKPQYGMLGNEEFLAKLMQEKKNIERVYGQEVSRLDYISYLMTQLNLDRALAEFSVDFIVGKITQQHEQQNDQALNDNPLQPYLHNSTLNDDIQLSQRRMICSKPKKHTYLYPKPKHQKPKLQNRSAVLLTHLTFVNDY